MLFAHPVARDHLSEGILRTGGSVFLDHSPSLPWNLASLPAPDSPESCALWVFVGAERIARGHDLSPEEMLRLIEVCEQGRSLDPENALWTQVQAALWLKLGDVEQAMRAWSAASRAARWNDYQNARLYGVVDGLRRETGHTLAWHYALAAGEKSISVVRLASGAGRQLLNKVYGTPLQAQVQFETAMNGGLMRDGARHVEASHLGWLLVEQAGALPSEPARTLTPRGRVVARFALLDELRVASSPYQVERLLDVFATNDAWEAFVNPGRTEAHFRTLTFGTVATAAVPGALFLVGCFGILMACLGGLIARFPPCQRIFRLPWAPLLGVLAGVLSYLWTNLIFPAVWMTIVFSSFAIVHEKARSKRPFLNPVHTTTLWGILFFLGVSLTVTAAVLSVPGQYMLESHGYSDIYGKMVSSQLAISTVLVGLVLVTSVAWGYVTESFPHELVSSVLSRSGIWMCLVSWTLMVASLPVSVAMDRRLEDTMAMLFHNEPVYYLIR